MADASKSDEIPKELPHSDHEDGEISDDEDDTPVEIPTNQSNLSINYSASDDEESPEDVIKAYAEKQKQIARVEQEVAVDPKLCKVCVKNEHKYRCPRCDIRTCSLICSKKHKAENECDGIRQPFTKVEKLSQYDSQKSIDDQKFMHLMKEKAGLGAETSGSSGTEVSAVMSDTEEKPFDPNALRYTTNSPTERYLLNAARFRHVWLGYTDAPGNESRHEQHSDTVFWNLKLAFKKQLADGNVDIFEKTILNIPETIRTITVLKQFLKPRQYGCIVSEGDLDLEKLKPFIDREIDDVNIYMEVHGIPDRYYGVIADQTILESTRNRVVADHPKFVITLMDEFVEEMKLLSSEDLNEIAKKYGGIGGNERFGGGGRGRGGRGFHRGGGGGRGGGNGGGGQNNFRKRPGQFGGHDGGFKRGRGGGGNFNRRGGYQNRNNQPLDTFDPFEPFAGPTRLPIEYCS